MSCCDNSTVMIVNNTGVGVTIKGTSTSKGSLSGFSDGDGIPAVPGSSLTGSARATSLSQGVARGSVTVEIGGSTSFTLPYSFDPKNIWGHCPCTSSAGDTQKSGNYQAVASMGNGSSEGKAYVNWTLSSGWA